MAPQLANRTLCVGRINPEALEKYNAAHFKGNEAPTLGGARDFSCAVSGFGHATFIFGLCQPPTDTEESRARKKKKKNRVSRVRGTSSRILDN